MALPVVLLGLAAAYFLNKDVEQKKVDAKSISLVPVDLQATSPQDIKLKVQATNPSKSTFTINSLTLNLYYKNDVIGTIVRKDPFTIKQTDNSIIALQVKPNAGKAVATILTLLFNKKEKFKNIKVLGAYNYMGLTFPIDKTIQLNA